jgi:hypothetical protein
LIRKGPMQLVADLLLKVGVLGTEALDVLLDRHPFSHLPARHGVSDDKVVIHRGLFQDKNANLARIKLPVVS